MIIIPLMHDPGLVAAWVDRERSHVFRLKQRRFAPLAGALAAVCCGLTAGVFANENLRAAAEVIVVSDQKQLFIDDLFVTQAQQVTWRMHPALKTGDRTLEQDQPWESASLNWFSVVQHDGKFRMWYECYDVGGWTSTNDTSFCYAESGDGIRWVKPNLGLFNYHGSTNNNILFRQLGPPGAHSRASVSSHF